MLRWLRRRHTIEKLLIYILVICLLITAGKLSYSSSQQHGDSAAQFFNPAKQQQVQDHKQLLYFETEAGYRERVAIQDKIEFGARIKQFNSEVFNKREGYNEEYLDKIPLIREFPDFKPAGCGNVTYNYTATTVSVIINYHNELLSLLLRTIYSVINSIPPHNFKELILIDDASNLTAYYHLRIIEPLVDSFTVPVRFYRFEENKGLVFCRRFGAQNAKGDVILIIDSHVELAPGFLPPLLNITDNNYKAIAAPIFDFYETFEDRYWHYDGNGFGYDQYFGWVFTNGPTDYLPWRTPGVMGGALMATKRRLEELDYFGRGMIGWGGENIEISMKSWMCDGEMYFVPCSRCLHFAARRFPDSHGDRVRPEKPMLNIATVAKSFLTEEEYEEYLRGRTNARGVHDEEAVNINKYLLKNLKCSRNYKWIRRNLMQEMESFDGETLLAHTLQQDGWCVVVYNDRNHWVLEPCTPQGLPPRAIINRVRLTKLNELRFGARACLDFGYEVPKLVGCHKGGGNQKVYYNSNEKRVRSGSNKCLTKANGTTTLTFQPCVGEDADKTSQIFQFDVIYHPDVLNKS